MGIGKAAAWTLEALRSIMFLAVGLFALGAVERPLTDGKELAPIQMLLFLAANLTVLYVLHRSGSGSAGFTVPRKNRNCPGQRRWRSSGLRVLPFSS
ncbi:hypothetical protein VQ056_21035 [Paenibacillus sp. JTLBN-2024]